VISLDMPDADYRAAAALSYSAAKTLMRSPALYAWELEHGRPDKTEFDVGHAAHALILGVGAEVAVGEHPKTGEPFTDWRTKAAREFADNARAEGKTPLLASQNNAVLDMADAVLAHPIAGKRFENGWPEVSVFWTDEATGTAQRARLDWLIAEDGDGRPRAVDLKTCTDVRRGPLTKHIAEHYYHWQDSHYLEGLYAHSVDDAVFDFVFVEKTPPHLVRVIELDVEARAAGARFMAEARRRYAAFLEHGPGFDYPTADVFGLPRYAPTDPEDLLP
jgi:hypothetical protein